MTPKMQPEHLGYNSCSYLPAYSRRCGKLSLGRHCDDHAGRVCCVCGDESTHQCSYAAQFVCGAELCDNCEGWEDRSKPGGSWGTLNHFHKRKPDAPPIHKMVAEDIGLCPYRYNPPTSNGEQG